MTKSELIKTVAKQASLTEAQTNEAVKALTDVITAPELSLSQRRPS